LAALGAAAAEEGQTDAARRAYREAMPMLKAVADRDGATFDDTSTYAEHLLASPLAEFRDPAQAVVYAKRAVALSHNTAPKYLEQLSRAYEAAGQQASAIAVQEQAIAAMPNSSPWRAIAGRRLALLKAPTGKTQ
jgi:tetratricopeptide (TPR) repeat protein